LFLQSGGDFSGGVIVLKTLLKRILSLAALSFLLIGARHVCAAEKDWHSLGLYDGVKIEWRVVYFPYDCEVRWWFTNTNDYPVRVEVSKKTYKTNYGSYFVEKHYQSFIDVLPPGQNKGTLGDHLPYNDKAFGGRLDSRSMNKNRSKMTPFEVTGVEMYYLVKPAK
jgi:hypothetical protein